MSFIAGLHLVQQHRPSLRVWGPTNAEASWYQSFTFLVRDQRLGANIGSAMAPPALVVLMLTHR